MDFNENTVSAVIGGTSGIGRAVAEALAARPGRVVVAGRTTALDVADEASVTAFFEKLGAIDHLVYTAGSAAPGGKVGDVSIAAAKTAFDVKFWGSIIVAREAAKRMKAGGSITLTSGFLARRTVPGTFVKTAMNAGIEAVAKLLARELAPLRDTEAYGGMASSARQAMLERAAASLPAGRHGRPQDLAQGYLFSIDNPFVTGAVLDIDGGALVN